MLEVFVFGIADLYWQVNESVKMCSARMPFIPHQPATVLWPGLEQNKVLVAVMSGFRG